jgi:F420-0:gamma-glutamyl ligase
MKGVQLFVVPAAALQPGDDVAARIVEQLAEMGEGLLPGDIVVVVQKIVSKAEGRLVRLLDVEPDEQAQQLAELVGKDPRVLQVILEESNEVLRARRGLPWSNSAAAGFALMQGWTAATCSRTKRANTWPCCPPTPMPVPLHCAPVWPS